jgi:hypothetical protein
VAGPISGSSPRTAWSTAGPTNGTTSTT